MDRTSSTIVLVFYLIAAPAGAYLFLTGPSMGYAPAMAGMVAGALALPGLVLLALAFFAPGVSADPADSELRAMAKDELPSAVGWYVFVGFLLVMVGIVAYTILTSN